MNDATESIRRHRLIEINADPGDREALQTTYGTVWNAEELARDFRVIGFLAPLVVVERKRDGQVGLLEFQHHPRFYFNFVPDSVTATDPSRPV